MQLAPTGDMAEDCGKGKTMRGGEDRRITTEAHTYMYAQTYTRTHAHTHTEKQGKGMQ